MPIYKFLDSPNINKFCYSIDNDLLCCYKEEIEKDLFLI